MTDRMDRVAPARVALALAVAMAVAGCAGPGGAVMTEGPPSVPPPATASPSTAGRAPSGPVATPGPTATAAPTPAGAILTQPWATAALTDVRTGTAFRIADLVAAGSVVFLEPMAVWCSKCRAQQGEAVAAFERLDRTKVVWVGIDVETAESAQQLARYADQNGFDFSFAIADRDLSRALVAEFGEVVLNPPATNVIVIATDGRITHSTGHLAADELIALAASHGAPS